MSINTYIALHTTTVSTATDSVTLDLSAITGYTDLKIEINATAASTAHHIFFRLNGDTGSNYSWTYFGGDGSSAATTRATSQTEGRLTYAAAVRSGSATLLQANFQNYSNSTTKKTILSRNNRASDGVEATVNLWSKSSLEPITSINFFTTGPQFAVGSTFTVYGITTAETLVKATGGIVSEDATYTYHTFGSSGTFIPKQSLTADILVVAGGGGPGNSYGGGGGGGGVIYFANQSLTATSYTCTVGAGGANVSYYGANGSNSTFGALTAAVGGGGGGGQITSGNPSAGVAGGSGGGGGASNAAGGLAGGATTQTGTGATAYYGSAGSAGANGASGGGGGAGGAGGTVSGRVGGAAGAGTSAYSSWGSTTSTGVNVLGTYYYGGGGSGNGENGVATPGAGGTVFRTSGIANTGQGAGGDTTTAKGGSGVVIIRYPK